MKKKDQVFSFSNPRLLGAVYFGLLSVVGTMLINALLTVLGFKEIAPLFQAVIWGMIVASCTGAIFGKQIIYSKKPYEAKTFFTGFGMVLISLPFFNLGILYLMKQSHNTLFTMNNWHEFTHVFFVTLGYSYLLFGFLLAVAAGLAAMYLRGRLVYDILNTDNTPMPPTFEEPQTKVKKVKKA